MHHEVKDSVVIPLSELVKEVHIVKLDTAKEALIGGGEVVISENYIGLNLGGRSLLSYMISGVNFYVISDRSAGDQVNI